NATSISVCWEVQRFHVIKRDDEGSISATGGEPSRRPPGATSEVSRQASASGFAVSLPIDGLTSR
ncbi:MAG: hypothetical protein ACE5JI_05730, partial [Acidobacteriota bacterium]